jgi:hypothetical protein
MGKWMVEFRLSPWHGAFVKTIALELERTLARLGPEKARVLESRVRKVISEVAGEKSLPTIEEMKRRMPEFADVIGSLGDAEFELPPDLPLAPAKTW